MNPLQSSLIISIAVHGLILWWLFSTVLVTNNRISQVNVEIFSSEPEISKSEGTSSTRKSQPLVKRSEPGRLRKPFASTRQGGAAAEPLQEPTLQPMESAAAGHVASFGTGTTPIFEGEAGGEPGGVAIGPQRTDSSAGGLTSEARGVPGSGGPAIISGSGSGASRKHATPSEVDSFSGAEIPGYVIDAAGHRPPDAGAIYPDVDKYVLYGADKRTPINVLGTEVCIDGEFLRSKEATTISEIKTDYSMCRYLDFGDEAVTVKCPPEAQTKLIHYNSYLSSPLVYSVRTCLEYDTSNCYLTTDQETEREMCRIDFQYEGLWAEGTKFFYRCANSETRTYRQPLQYNIRWFMEIYIEERGLRKREILRETRAVSQCG